MEIMNLNILDVSNYWFNKNNTNKWFNASLADDEEITNKFLHYLQLKNYDNLSNSLSEKLSYIILYDQMVRHFYRNDKNNIKEYHEKALFLAMQILTSNVNDVKNIESMSLTSNVDDHLT